MPDAMRQHYSGRSRTPQTEPARADQVKNNSGGFVFPVGDAARLHRFLTIGVEGGTAVVTERDLVRDNGSVVVRLAERSDPMLIDRAVEVSEAGRALSNDPALFAIAAAAGLGDEAYRKRALDVLPQVARTGSHLLTFAAYAEMFRGWGPQLVKGIRNWYLAKTPEELAYQLLKYKSREGWSQADLLRLAAFKAGPQHKAGQRWRAGNMPRVPAEHEALFNYVIKGTLPTDRSLPDLVEHAADAHWLVKAPDTVRRTAHWVRLIEDTRGLSHEMLPSEALAKPQVWRALVESGNLPQGALLRNLARLTTLGVLKQGDSFTNDVAARIADPDRLKRARVHPISILLGMKTYAGGHSLRGSGRWDPVFAVTDAMNAAFYAAFPAVEPAGNRVDLCLDISGTMASAAGGLPITCREVVAAVALVTAKTEPLASIYGFGSRYTPLDISPARRLDDVAKYMRGLGMQRTDCAVPMVQALRDRRAVDTFTVYTDNETYAGPVHVHEALRDYREGMGIDARLQVVCIVPTEFSVADPLDPRQLDVSGFDSAVPVLLADHGRGDL